MKNAVIITTTFYTDSEEGKLRKNLARNFFIKASEKDYPVCLVDGGTDNGKFIEEVRSLGVNSYEETQHGLGGSRREALKYGLKFAFDNNLPYIVWSEPEKGDFVSSLDELVLNMDKTKTHLIVPSRKKFENYPLTQINSESFGNQRHTDYGYVDKNKKPLDTFFGPKIWRKEISGFFQVFENPKVAAELAKMRLENLEKLYKINTTKEIEEIELKKAITDLKRTDHMQHMPVCMMIKKNGTIFGTIPEKREYNVLSVDIDYKHPEEQLELESRQQSFYNAKRLNQVKALDEQFALVDRIHKRGVLDKELDALLMNYKGEH